MRTRKINKLIKSDFDLTIFSNKRLIITREGEGLFRFKSTFFVYPCNEIFCFNFIANSYKRKFDKFYKYGQYPISMGNGIFFHD